MAASKATVSMAFIRTMNDRAPSPSPQHPYAARRRPARAQPRRPVDARRREIPNRVVLAPLAGIGNWFVRLQAKRYGAGLVVSEMVSSHADPPPQRAHLRELLRIHPDEHPVSVQLFGADPDVMASAAERVAAAGADLIDINMGCPVPKVCKTGAGAALLGDPDRAVAVARAAGRGSGLPVTVKLRSGVAPGDGKRRRLARRLAQDGVVAGLCIHPRHASQRHSGQPDYALAAAAGGGAAGAGAHLRRPALPGARPRGVRAHGRRGRRARPRLARQPVAVLAAACGGATHPAHDAGVLDELNWVMDRAAEHLGAERAARYLRKFYPWYLERLGATDKALQDGLQRADTLASARELLGITDR